MFSCMWGNVRITFNYSKDKRVKREKNNELKRRWTKKKSATYWLKSDFINRQSNKHTTNTSAYWQTTEVDLFLPTLEKWTHERTKGPVGSSWCQEEKRFKLDHIFRLYFDLTNTLTSVLTPHTHTLVKVQTSLSQLEKKNLYLIYFSIRLSPSDF